jgi:hypothetical protein
MSAQREQPGLGYLLPLSHLANPTSQRHNLNFGIDRISLRSGKELLTKQDSGGKPAFQTAHYLPDSHCMSALLKRLDV